MATMATETKPSSSRGAEHAGAEHTRAGLSGAGPGHAGVGQSRPNSWGLGDGQAIPWEYSPAPESREIVTIRERYGLVIGGKEVRRIGRRHLHDPQSGDRGAPGRDRPGDRGRRRRGGPRRPPGAVEVLGQAARPRAGQVPVPDRPPPPGALARVRGARIDGLRQADQGVARRRRAPRGGPLLVLRRVGRQARLRVPGPGRPAARRGRPGDSLELPAPDAGLEDRPGPGRRQYRRPQAGQHDAAERAPVRRAVPPGRPAAGRGQHHHRPGRDRDGPGDPSRRGQGRLHRLDGGRPQDRPGDRRPGQGPDPRARRQGGQHRLRRRAARPGRRGDHQRDLLQPGRGVLRGQPPARPGVDRRAS